MSEYLVNEGVSSSDVLDLLLLATPVNSCLVVARAWYILSKFSLDRCKIL